MTGFATVVHTDIVASSSDIFWCLRLHTTWLRRLANGSSETIAVTFSCAGVLAAKQPTTAQGFSDVASFKAGPRATRA